MIVADEVFSDFDELAEEIYQGKIGNFILGDRESRIVGDGYDFYDISEWEPGDPFDTIDWQLTLPSWPEKIIKVNRIETKELPTLFVLDVTPSMLIRFEANESKFRLTLRLMGAIGFSAVHAHDPVGVTVFGSSSYFFLPPRHGKGNIFHAIEILLDDANNFYENIVKKRVLFGPFFGAKSIRPVNMNECLSEIIGRVRTQSLVVVVSDFADVLYGRVRLDEDILSGLVARHKENVIFLILDDEHEFSWSGGVGTIMSRGIETGKLKEIRMSHAGLIRAEHAEKQLKFQKYLEDQGIDSLVLSSSNWLDRLTEFAATRHGLSTV